MSYPTSYHHQVPVTPNNHTTILIPPQPQPPPQQPPSQPQQPPPLPRPQQPPPPPQQPQPPPPPPPNLPSLDLLEGSREDCINIGIPLFQAAIKGDWKAAKPILENWQELVRYAITENKETLLHIAASAESTKAVENFVENLVNLMERNDLELQNRSYDTALSLAAQAGNLETTKIMIEKNPLLPEIANDNKITPLYMAALFAKPDMVRYLHNYSNHMRGDCWDNENRGWVLQKCVEAKIFDVALKIVDDYPSLPFKKKVLSNVLLALAHNTQAFEKKETRVQKHNVNFERFLFVVQNDSQSNNMLHMVGKKFKQKRLQHVSGAAFQMQRELLWYKEVEKMVPPKLKQKKNKGGQTPQELFTETHERLLKGGEWMRHTSSQCMVVATLIATIVFAAAFTLPGGYNQNTGIPFFRKEPSLIIFVISDAVSLICSSTSILMFLSILTSRYAEDDFLESLPRKLVNGIATLFLSIVTMMIAFSASFFVLYNKKLEWIPITITCLADIPVTLYVILHQGLFMDVFKAAYQAKRLFKRTNKRTLYS
ncbi:uncharacterized protein LOC143592930 [Bidens hawaiensis]|uniref:uncharacterized protein LOC143592930 n=1 Tax=Bidens hawaiensis TaxID=980011 RepID=UPI0040492B56